MRLIRTTILLAGAGIFLPSPPPDPAAGTGVADATTVTAYEMLTSATSAFGDVAGFCGRQPSACETAAYVAARLQIKAKYNAGLLYRWATSEDKPAGSGVVAVTAPAADPLRTASSGPLPAPSPHAGQSTLRLDDLIPAWRVPADSRHEG